MTHLQFDVFYDKAPSESGKAVLATEEMALRVERNLFDLDPSTKTRIEVLEGFDRVHINCESLPQDTALLCVAGMIRCSGGEIKKRISRLVAC